MHTTHQLIELAKQRLAEKHGLPLPMTDYRFAKLMGLNTATVSAWRTGVRSIGTEFVRKFADACGLSAEYIYACTLAERTDSEDEISLLERIAAAFKDKAAIGALVAAGMLFAPGPEAHAAQYDISPHYAPHGRRKKRREPQPFRRFPTLHAPA